MYKKINLASYCVNYCLNHVVRKWCDESMLPSVMALKALKYRFLPISTKVPIHLFRHWCSLRFPILPSQNIMGDNDAVPNPYLSYGCLIQPPEEPPEDTAHVTNKSSCSLDAISGNQSRSAGHTNHTTSVTSVSSVNLISRHIPNHFTSTTSSGHQQYNSHEQIEQSFAEMVTETPLDRAVPLVVLDCANIGWCYGIDSFSAHGVCIAIAYFQSLQVEVQAFLPAAYMRVKPRRTDNISGMV